MVNNTYENAINLEFFFDPICPWAYLTSRFVEEVKKVRNINIKWRFIALYLVNKERFEKEPDFEQRYGRLHALSAPLLRACVGIESDYGQSALGEFYTALGKAIHLERDEPFLESKAVLEFFESNKDYDINKLEPYTKNDAFDKVIEEDTRLALSRTGKDVGTPIISYNPPEGPSFFGPVMSKLLKGEEAGSFFDHLYQVVTTEGFHELKQAARTDRRF